MERETLSSDTEEINPADGRLAAACRRLGMLARNTGTERPGWPFISCFWLVVFAALAAGPGVANPQSRN